MNTHEKYIRETNQFDTYVEWLEVQIIPVNEPDENSPEYDSPKNIRKRLIDGFTMTKNYETKVWYDAVGLSYQTEIIFPRVLGYKEKLEVENIINYWSHIPYVSIEGNYGMEWKKVRKNSIAVIEIDFTKSASDDYGAREILEKLADWVENGTPVKKDNTQKYKGVIKPLIVRADSV